jgi:4-aminobutyrate aminotransferase
MGYLFGCEHLKVSPDIICLAKALGGGLPLGAIIAPARIMNWPAGAHTSTFGGNPVACAAALAFLDLLEGGLLDHSRKVSEYLWEGLKQMVQGHPHVGEVRGRGMMIGFTMVRNRRNFKPAADAVDAVLNRSFEKGLLLLGGGEGVVRLTPPLILTKKEADIGLGILKQVLSEVKVKESAQ